MEIANNFNTSIHIALKKLIEEKSKRDNTLFTASQLAAALGMPRSMISKLTHQDEGKRVINPRIDTLLKIVDFFNADGFQISLETLLGIELKTIDINPAWHSITHLVSVSIFEFDDENTTLGTININLNKSSQSKNIVALKTNRDIKPLFKAGSIFVIDKDMSPEDDTLVVIKLGNSNEILLRKYHYRKSRVILKSFDNADKDIVLMPTAQCKIIGVVIHINAKT